MNAVNEPYLFTSNRLGFRYWQLEDLDLFADMNVDPEVMRCFPSPLTRTESKDFIHKLIKHQKDYGHSYFAVEHLKNKEFIGFIGLAYQTYESHFTPATDIGWRLKRSAWGNGYATEGATRCLDLAFEKLKLDKILSTCTLQNAISKRVMQKIGMKKVEEFDHPRLQEYNDLVRCVRYEINRDLYNKAKDNLPF